MREVSGEKVAGEVPLDGEGEATSTPRLMRAEPMTRISGVGMAIPERMVPNSHFESYLETSDEWIRTRTGILERHWAEDGVTASELAEPAARDALAQAGLDPADVDGIVFATVTPDNVFPSAACCLQRRLGIAGTLAFDVNAVCSGFLYALATADSFIESGLCGNILVVGADLFSRLIDKQDRSTCVLFGDGAGAVVLSKKQGVPSPERGHVGSPRGVSSESGIYSAVLGADGAYGDLLYVRHGEKAEEGDGHCGLERSYLNMEGREVFKVAVKTLADVSTKALSKAEVAVSDIDYVVSHQANERILLSLAKYLKIDPDKILVNVDRYGNTSAASIPILLAESVNSGKIRSGDLLLLNAFGGGLTWGAIVLRW